jgi:hypothetical protein
MNQPKQDGLTILLFLCAIALSATAAFYAVSGLVAIFAAAVIPIVVMGSMLEMSKLVVASWLYRNWKYTSFLLRSYFCVALTVLMLLTSMGIFGYLSKAHLDQAVPTGDVASKVAILDEKIKTEKENVSSARKALQQMDAQVDQTIARTTDDKGAERSVQIRRGQQKERNALIAEIGSAQTRIARLNEERAPIASELRKVEAEVGPIKYIAALIYGDNPDQNVLEKAVRIVIIMIVIVFDPMAVLMLIAVNQTLSRKEENEPTTIPEQEAIEPKAKDSFSEETEDEPITVPTYASQEPTFQWSEEVSSETTPEPETPAEAGPEPEQPVLFDRKDFNIGSASGSLIASGDTKVEPDPQSVELVETIYQKINTTNASDVREILERPTAGRPDRYK